MNRYLIVCFLLVIGVSTGCKRELPERLTPTEEVPQQNTAAATPEAVIPETTDTASPSTDQVDVSIEQAIPAEAISTRLELVGTPTYSDSDDTLRIKIRIHNDGSTNLISKGSAMVKLGLMLIGPNGPDTLPGNRDFVRVDLPLISPGKHVEVEASLPADPLSGLPIRAELVQEGINWFSAYGQPGLDIGSFQRCVGNAKILCDSNNQPLTKP